MNALLSGQLSNGRYKIWLTAGPWIDERKELKTLIATISRGRESHELRNCKKSRVVKRSVRGDEINKVIIMLVREAKPPANNIDYATVYRITKKLTSLSLVL